MADRLPINSGIQFQTFGRRSSIPTSARLSDQLIIEVNPNHSHPFTSKLYRRQIISAFSMSSKSSRGKGSSNASQSSSKKGRTSQVRTGFYFVTTLLIRTENAVCIQSTYK